MPHSKKPKSITGVSGMLMHNGIQHFIRVYGENFHYDDYLINHHDLEITITDPDAFVYPVRKDTLFDGVIDNSPETLGLKQS